MDHQPQSPVSAQKNTPDRLIAYASQRPEWAIGFLDAVWWSRFAQPLMQAWQKDDPDPKALACYCVLWQTGFADAPDRTQIRLRFVTGRPVSAISMQFLEYFCERLAAQGKRNWLLIWDNATWYSSKMARTWLREHNQQVEQTDKGVRILPFFLSTRSPWLNPIEPKWVHAKKAIVEPNGLLSAKQLA